MPLIKRSDAKAATPPVSSDAVSPLGPSAQEIADAIKAQTAGSAARSPIYTGRKGVGDDDKLSKDGYWRRREDRDIETGIRIRRSGIYQAALQSAGVNQYASGNTLEDYLKVVRKAAEDGLAFINEEAK